MLILFWGGDIFIVKEVICMRQFINADRKIYGTYVNWYRHKNINVFYTLNIIHSKLLIALIIILKKY